jgi:hypothetical protein
MIGRFSNLVLLAGYAVLAQSMSAQEIHLKTRTLSTGPGARIPAPRPRTAGPVHQIIQFDHAPGVEDLESLAAAGARVVAMVPDNAVMVSLPRRVRTLAAGMRWRGELEPPDKLSPELPREGIAPVMIEFHADVTTDVQESIAESVGLVLLRPPSLLSNHAIANAAVAQQASLAAHDEVAYIFPADPALLQANDSMPCMGMVTLAGAIAQYSNIVHGWSVDADGAAHLGYVFGDLSPKIPASTIQSEIIRALNEWSSHANIIFYRETNSSAPRTVLVRFASGPHGDPYPFDGPGGILAHTFYPLPVNPESIAGDMHLDADENWHAGGDVDIYSVALHEAGHAIGLGHSDQPGDVMYPYYRRGMQLSARDIGAAQALYGAPGLNPPVPISAAPLPSPVPLNLVLNTVPPPGQAVQISLSGTISGGAAPVTIQWQTDHGYSGKATAGIGGTWTAAGITLATGANIVTISAVDSAHQTVTQSVSITRLQTAPVSGGAPVSISISTPSSAVFSTGNTTISLAGTAAGGTGITQVTWQTSSGARGNATGADRWIAANIPLLTGTNTIIVHAVDAKGASAWASVVVVHR